MDIGFFIVGRFSPQSCLTLAISWTVAHQSPLPMGFPRQEYWLGLPFPPLEDLPNPRIKPGSPALQADSLLTESPGKLIYLKKERKVNVLKTLHVLNTNLANFIGERNCWFLLARKEV